MKPNFNPKRGDMVRVRHPELGVVDAEYGSMADLFFKFHSVYVGIEHCFAQRTIHSSEDGSSPMVRFVYPVECMPDYKNRCRGELKMFELDFFCHNENCEESIEYKCEYESASEGSSHKIVCPHCGTVAVFEIGYKPCAKDVRAE